FPQYFLRSFAYAGIAVVLLAAAAALILLPAALMLLGPRVNALDLRRLLRRRKKGAAAAEAPLKEPGRAWARFGGLVMRRAPVFAIVTAVGLVLLGLPFLGVKFGTADDRQLPVGAESRVVQEHIRDGFPGSPR
ncbi:MMPL family transporter, partial [Streptomyces sp. DSM 41014]|nr:MMPL family transporter [Streptomyces sp. DSM 41014]